MSGYPYQQQPGAPRPSGNPFADQVNPYAAPQATAFQPQMAAAAPSKFPGLWRKGNVLVMHKMAPLPDICLMSNQPATRRLKRNLQWHHPLIAITILAGLLVYVILALILTKRATIHIPLTEEWYERRKRRMIFSWCAGLAFLGLIFLNRLEVWMWNV
jgi:phage shock protein PspC (stress-responsive transcriptional regulator)